ncbi:MAG TPA: hypothetical protein VFL80_05160, partial [Thermoanaerobaculia bacterium]|nr:hypothetical protein [Thermoanaerobaculia bacterium]
MSDLDQLRQQLRQRGYLTLGIERWFALDPWSSRTFWAELLVVTSKAAVLIAPFVAAVAVAIMLVRNHPLSPVDTALLLVLYAGAGWVFAFVIVLAIALLLKLRPAIAIDSPAALLAISLGAALLLSLPLLLWWNGFEGERTTAELLGGGVLLAILLICSAIVIAAALLSFSIHEVQRIPSAVRRPRAGPMAVAASALLVGLFVPAWAGPQQEPSSPQQIAVSSDYRPLVLIAVDGLRADDEIADETLSRLLPHRASLSRLSSDSPPEKWATVGTGVKTALHRVRAIEGIELAGGRRLIQAVSRRDVV